jgi:hypothetical protein
LLSFLFSWLYFCCCPNILLDLNCCIGCIGVVAILI